MKSILLTTISFSLTCVTIVQEQLNDLSSYNIKFQNELISVERDITSFKWDKMPTSSEFQNGYYEWIHFFETPDQDARDGFKLRSLTLIEYITNRSYIFSVPENTSIQYLKDKGVRAIVPLESHYKISTELKQLSFEENLEEDNHLLVMSY